MFRWKKSWISLSGIAVLCATLLAACGSNSSSSSPAPSAEAASPAPSAVSTPAPAKADGPKRIAVMYFPYADHLFALGHTQDVKGVVNMKALKNLPVYDPILQGDSIADLGDEASMEKIIAMNPDLIIASQFDEKIVDQLSKIAKTVTINTTLNWQDTITQVAAQIGEEAKAKQYIEDFNKRQGEVAASIEQSGQKGKTAIFMMLWKKGFYYWGGPRMSLYYDKLGFQPPEGVTKNGEIDLEGLSKLNPEYIFIGNDYTNASEINLKDLESNSVWQSLSAVKNNKMFIVDTDILGPLAMGQSKGLDVMQKLMQAGK